MATGLIALLDDVAAIAKLAAASLDDVAAQTLKASTKAAGVVIDDTAVTPRYVVGLSPARELPIIGRIALGSLKNKLIFLLPLCLLLGYFAPWLITPLLMIGGIYLCFEGAEKLHEAVSKHPHDHGAPMAAAIDPAQIEKQKVAGAIRTDFILSAEIMALTLAGVSTSGFYTQAAVLAGVGVFITVAVYGVVAVIVKADDIGLAMAANGSAPLRAIGKGLVLGVPAFLQVLAAVGTGAMLWVGGSILVHGLASLGLHEPEHFIDRNAEHAVSVLPILPTAVDWLATSLQQAILGLIVGAIAIAVLALMKPALARLGSSHG
jgi:predicted DNA repair protein MutK